MLPARCPLGVAICGFRLGPSGVLAASLCSEAETSLLDKLGTRS